MGLFGKLIRSAAREIDRQQRQAARNEKRKFSYQQMAERLMTIISESIEIAEGSKKPDTKVSRLGVARDKLDRLCEIVDRSDPATDAIVTNYETKLDALALDFEGKHVEHIAEGIKRGKTLEQAEKIDEAIELYESLAALPSVFQLPYRRLAMLYKKTKQPEQEKRILVNAIASIPSTDTDKQWFIDRLDKIREREEKAAERARKRSERA